MLPSAPLLNISLNVYNYTRANCLLQLLGIGLYHTGLQINGIEYQFICCSQDPRESGVCSIRPGAGGFPFCRNIPLAVIPVPFEQFDRIFKHLQAKYTVGSYNLFSNNCNHFISEFVLELTGIVLPNYLFRMTNCLGMFNCCLPHNYLNGQWALADYKRDVSERAQEFLPLRDRIKIDLNFPISPEALQLYRQKEMEFS